MLVRGWIGGENRVWLNMAPDICSCGLFFTDSNNRNKRDFVNLILKPLSLEGMEIIKSLG